MTAGGSVGDCPVSLADRPVFTAGGVVFTVADIARRARSGDREVLLVGAGQAEESFRRSRGLLRADQLQEWLASWQIDPDDFRRWAADAAAGTTTATAWCTVVCSGSFDATTGELLGATAAACALGEPPTSPADFDPSGWVERLVAERTSAPALSAVLAAHRLEWTRFRTTSCLAPTRGAAEELRHQVLSDGTDLAEAAARAGWPVHALDDVLEALAPAEARTVLPGAQGGELVGPLAAGGSWVVVAVEERTEPDLADPATLARAEAVVRNDVIARAVARYVVA
ncbi:MAG: hypothetical protein JWQ74_67 [Marmoricola sp.]|nr:hypothetical protein [Marmoricola sp.]